MKPLMIILFFSSFNLTSLENCVIEFHDAKSEADETAFIEKYKNESISYQPYVIAFEMKRATYAFAPWTKWRIFRENKKKLESLIESNPDNIHLRYIRLLIQEKVPSIIGYSSEIEEDKAFLQSHFEKLDSTIIFEKHFKKNTSL